MTTFKTGKAKDRAERKAYRALDALQDLVDRGICGQKAEKAMGAVRDVINEIQSAVEKSTNSNPACWSIPSGAERKNVA